MKTQLGFRLRRRLYKALLVAFTIVAVASAGVSAVCLAAIYSENRAGHVVSFGMGSGRAAVVRVGDGPCVVVEAFSGLPSRQPLAIFPSGKSEPRIIVPRDIDSSRRSNWWIGCVLSGSRGRATVGIDSDGHLQFARVYSWSGGGLPSGARMTLVYYRNVIANCPDLLRYTRIPPMLLAMFWARLCWLRLWRRHVQRWRALRNRCCACGYDLRATPLRCPECGTSALRACAMPQRDRE